MRTSLGGKPFGAQIVRAVLYLLIVAVSGRLQAQNLAIARVTSVTGTALLSMAGAPQFALSRGYVLNPGDAIDTRGGGRVVIDLSDGSLVIVQPDSIVNFKDFQAASSVRELFEITLGRVRVTIHHLGGRPNPYRMNTPTASIAVRGTEFSVAVDSRGETRVAVYEGAVEVISLADPSQKVLLEPGRGVLVIPGQDFYFFNAPAENDLASTHDSDHRNTAATDSGSASSHGDRDVSPRTTADTYERYINSLWQVGQVPFLLRYNASPEAHLDSLENPAYAAGFRSAEAQVYLVPSFAGLPGSEGAERFGEGGERPPGYGISSQATMFAPVPGSRFVIGGSVTTSYLSNGIQGLAPATSFGVLGSSNTNGADLRNFVSGSLIVARQLDAQTSAGVSFERLSGSGSLYQTVMAPNSLLANIQQTTSASTISQTRMTFGLERHFYRSHTVGAYYRYGFIGANDNAQNALNGSPLPFDYTRSSGHSSEIGVRLRGPLTRKIAYGLEASWVGVSLSDALVRTAGNSNQSDGGHRSAMGLGLAYTLNRRTVLNLDLSGGASRAGTARREDSTGNVLQTGSESSRFLSSHVAVQANVWRGLYLLSSFMYIWQSQAIGTQVFPDQLGNTVAIADPFLAILPNLNRPATRYSDFGLGWRFTPNLLAQFTYSTDYGATSDISSLVLRYTFHLLRE